MNIKDLKNQDFIRFIESEVRFDIKTLRPVMTRACGKVVVEFSDPDNGFASTPHGKFTFTNSSCVRQIQQVEKDLTKEWLEFADNLEALSL